VGLRLDKALVGPEGSGAVSCLLTLTSRKLVLCGYFDRWWAKALRAQGSGAVSQSVSQAANWFRKTSGKKSVPYRQAQIAAVVVGIS
jgi:hypothetical protein